MTVLENKIVTARKLHRCDFCHSIIKVGEQYNYCSIVGCDGLYHFKSHLDCTEYAKRIAPSFDGISEDDFQNQVQEDVEIYSIEKNTMHSMVKEIISIKESKECT